MIKIDFVVRKSLHEINFTVESETTEKKEIR